VVNHLVYDAFGKLTSESNPAVDSLFLFTARPLDGDTGLQNNLNRWYDPADGVQDHRTSVLTIIPSVDIDTDSDNTGTIDRSDWEEQIENVPDYPGELLVVNSDDDNENGIQDYLENDDYSYPEGGEWAPFADDDLFQVVLDRGFEDLSGMDGFAFELKVTAGIGLSYWLDQTKTPIVDDPVFGPDEVVTIVEAGQEKVVYRWFVSSGLLMCRIPRVLELFRAATARERRFPDAT